MIKIWIRLLGFWFYIDSWRYAISLAILGGRAKGERRPFSLKMLLARIGRIRITTYAFSLWWRISATISRVSHVLTATDIALAARVKVLLIKAGQPLCALVRIAKRKIARFRYLHFSIARRTTNSLFEYLAKTKNKAPLLAYFVEQMDKGTLQPDEIYGLLVIALEAHEQETVRRCADFLLLQYPASVDYQRGAATQCFLKAEYEIAEAIWTAVEEYRLAEIEKRGLDQYGVRYLAPHWFIAIGHIAHLDTFLKFQILHKVPARTYIPELPPSIEIPNKYFLDLWRPLLTNKDGNQELPSMPLKELVLLQEDFWSQRVSPGRALMFNKAGAIVQRAWEEQTRPSLLVLPEDDRTRGWGVLKTLGVPNGAWFACLHVREPGFHKAWHDKNPGTRNADVWTYREAIDAVVERGGFVVRLGDATMQPMDGVPGLVDYALSEAKSDFMDIFLCAECRFFIGTNSGLGLIPPVFGKPCVMTNWSPIAIPQWYPNDLFIPKLIYSEQKDRLLTYEEMFSTPAGWSQFEEYFKKNMMRVIDNSPDEIRDVVIEMMERLDGNASYSDSDLEMLSMFEGLSKTHAGYVGSRIGRDFLRQHAYF